MKKFVALAFFTTAFAVLSAFNISAQEMMKKPETEKPIVAIVKADWCGYCKRIDSVVSKLMEDYGERLNFVVFDVTNDEAVNESMKKAEMLGLGEFFTDFKNKTSTVAVLKNKEVVFKTSNNNNREKYVEAFEKVLKK